MSFIARSHRLAEERGGSPQQWSATFIGDNSASLKSEALEPLARRDGQHGRIA
jgi:hypothetical protein